ncbi:MAG: hypothetical protein M1820_010133 [Bogoriella megaspora]|nr:MAG: hypothetical protein M1820_010133 [Bogoriella megaspora]
MSDNKPLRSRLTGAWQLESYVALPSPGSPLDPVYPMTKSAQGILLYSSDGYMAANILIPGQRAFNAISEVGVDDAQWAEAGKRNFAYSGPFFITEEEGRGEVLRHKMQVSSNPNWTGDIQERTWRFEEDGKILVLSVDEPAEIKGEKRVPELRWRKINLLTRVLYPDPLLIEVEAGADVEVDGASELEVWLAVDDTDSPESPLVDAELMSELEDDKVPELPLL